MDTKKLSIANKLSQLLEAVLKINKPDEKTAIINILREYGEEKQDFFIQEFINYLNSFNENKIFFDSLVVKNSKLITEYKCSYDKIIDLRVQNLKSIVDFVTTITLEIAKLQLQLKEKQKLLEDDKKLKDEKEKIQKEIVEITEQINNSPKRIYDRICIFLSDFKTEMTVFQTKFSFIENMNSIENSIEQLNSSDSIRLTTQNLKSCLLQTIKQYTNDNTKNEKIEKACIDLAENVNEFFVNLKKLTKNQNKDILKPLQIYINTIINSREVDFNLLVKISKQIEIEAGTIKEEEEQNIAYTANKMQLLINNLKQIEQQHTIIQTQKRQEEENTRQEELKISQNKQEYKQELTDILKEIFLIYPDIGNTDKQIALIVSHLFDFNSSDTIKKYIDDYKKVIIIQRMCQKNDILLKKFKDCCKDNITGMYNNRYLVDNILKFFNIREIRNISQNVELYTSNFDKIKVITKHICANNVQKTGKQSLMQNNINNIEKYWQKQLETNCNEYTEGATISNLKAEYNVVLGFFSNLNELNIINTKINKENNIKANLINQTIQEYINIAIRENEIDLEFITKMNNVINNNFKTNSFHDTDKLDLLINELNAMKQQHPIPKIQVSQQPVQVVPQQSVVSQPKLTEVVPQKPAPQQIDSKPKKSQTIESKPVQTSKQNLIDETFKKELQYFSQNYNNYNFDKAKYEKIQQTFNSFVSNNPEFAIQFINENSDCLALLTNSKEFINLIEKDERANILLQNENIVRVLMSQNNSVVNSKLQLKSREQIQNIIKDPKFLLRRLNTDYNKKNIKARGENEAYETAITYINIEKNLELRQIKYDCLYNRQAIIEIIIGNDSEKRQQLLSILTNDGICRVGNLNDLEEEINYINPYLHYLIRDTDVLNALIASPDIQIPNSDFFADMLGKNISFILNPRFEYFSHELELLLRKTMKAKDYYFKTAISSTFYEYMNRMFVRNHREQAQQETNGKLSNWYRIDEKFVSFIEEFALRYSFIGDFTAGSITQTKLEDFLAKRYTIEKAEVRSMKQLPVFMLYNYKDKEEELVKLLTDNQQTLQTLASYTYFIEVFKHSRKFDELLLNKKTMQTLIQTNPADTYLLLDRIQNSTNNKDIYFDNFKENYSQIIYMEPQNRNAILKTAQNIVLDSKNDNLLSKDPANPKAYLGFSNMFQMCLDELYKNDQAELKQFILKASPKQKEQIKIFFTMHPNYDKEILETRVAEEVVVLQQKAVSQKSVTKSKELKKKDNLKQEEKLQKSKEKLKDLNLTNIMLLPVAETPEQKAQFTNKCDEVIQDILELVQSYPETILLHLDNPNMKNIIDYASENFNFNFDNFMEENSSLVLENFDKQAIKDYYTKNPDKLQNFLQKILASNTQNEEKFNGLINLQDFVNANESISQKIKTKLNDKIKKF